ncbi:MAG: phosphatidylserine decarboxylase family protein [Kiritimatiellae bacterium]|nr:phosphatidylserine decarboxylase family protein [Kiritimatiellia bacterium]
MNETAPDFSNAAYLFPHVNREGVKFGVVALAVAVATALLTYRVWWLCWLVLPVFLLAYGVFLFFRDPERYPPADGKAMLSPADGRICLVQECEMPDSFGAMEEFRGRRHWRVSVFMSVFDVHVNRMPTDGEIIKKEYVPAGKFFNASLDKASKENERCNYLVKAGNGQMYAVTQIAGLVARRIVPQADEGARLGRAERFGLIRFGSRLDVYLPEGTVPEVRVGQTMVAGETTIGHLT